MALPPVIVTSPSTPSVSLWSKVLNVRDSSRPVSASPREPTSGRAADHAARRSASRTAGISLAPSEYIRSTWSSGTERSSGSSTTHELVPTTDRPRCGTTMSPSPDLLKAVDDGVAEPAAEGEQDARGRADRHVDTRHRRDLLRPWARRVDHEIRVESSLRPVTWSCTTAPLTRPPWIGSSVTSVYDRMSAPLWCAVAKKRSASRIASIVPSGIRTAALSSGLRFGSSRSAWAGVGDCVGIPQAAQPSRNGSR